MINRLIRYFMKPTLFVLAAGMGSRYGGLKQLDGVGPNGETIMDYSIYDAIQAGFGKIVFVIRHHFEEAFREKVLAKYEATVETEVVFQEVDSLPQGYTCPKDREKPWGTGHAVLMGADKIKEPFAVINADDFYGRNSFEVLAQKLSNMENESGRYCMVGFELSKTLSESGAVSRGVCSVDAKNLLTGVVEHTGIIRKGDAIVCPDPFDSSKEKALPEGSTVSMNMWGFLPDFFEYAGAMWRQFLDERLNEPKSEFYIPSVVNELIETGKASVEVLKTKSHWFGVTYQEDRASVQAKLKELAEIGVYPNKLFK